MPDTVDFETARDFDLNIEKVLEAWDVAHAIREIIANALDECALTQTAAPSIFQTAAGSWVVRDFGRGLRYEHLTQNENAEKLDNPSRVIGRFGVGLKDALAVLNRYGIDVNILSAHGDITVVSRAKAGFEEVVTLHARVARPSDADMCGTRFEMISVKTDAIERAKSFFLAFGNTRCIETTRFGQILERRSGEPGKIYVNGLVVAEEQNFAFSYNITDLSKELRRALNRERTNVGRTAYTERVKAMLRVAESGEIARVLATDVANLSHGSHFDETGWIDVQVRACQIANANADVVFVTAEELQSTPSLVDSAASEGKQIIAVPSALSRKLESEVDLSGRPVQTLTTYAETWNQSFQYSFISESQLSPNELEVWQHRESIASLVGGIPRGVQVLLSETIRPSVTDGATAVGVWERNQQRIVIKRSQLESVEDFAGTLLHEIAHALSGYGDVSRGFEGQLTEFIGLLAGRAIMAPKESNSHVPRTSAAHRVELVGVKAFDWDRRVVWLRGRGEDAKFLLSAKVLESNDDPVSVLTVRFRIAAESDFRRFRGRVYSLGDKRALRVYLSLRLDAARLETVIGPTFDWVPIGETQVSDFHDAVRRLNWKIEQGPSETALQQRV